jgi:hypothetical protein
MLAKFHGGNPADYRNSFMAPITRKFPLEAGDVLLTIPKSQVEDDMKFLLRMAFAEPEIVKGNPIIDTLHDMTTHVRHVIFEFERMGLL